MRIPLFALNAVLFPAGVLPLRVFEARYMDMVRDCMKADSAFGVVLIRQGSEVKHAVEFEAEGTLARITAWDMPQLGLLHIRTVGEQRFRVVDAQRQPDGLNVAEIEPVPHDADSTVAPSHQSCVRLLERIVADLESNHTGKTVGASATVAQKASAATKLPIEPPYRFDSSVWVGNRLAELLPINLRAKQKLMMLSDALARLDLVRDYLQQRNVIE